MSRRAVHAVLGLWTAASVAGCTTCAQAASPPPSKAELRKAHEHYVSHFVQGDGRVVDRAGGGVSTSEGQSYAMVRAVWVQDRTTFDRARAWMLDNLQAGDPHQLPSWRWGQREDGSWGILDENPAADADVWAAYALALGASLWNDDGMRSQAKGLLDQIWTREVTRIDEHFVLLPGPWADGRSVVKINPSYSLPFAYRVFAELDPEHPWAELVDDSYWLLNHVTNEHGLQPDWAWLDATTGKVVPPPDGESPQEEFGFEAFRIPWTLAADARWYDEARAKALLSRMDGLRLRWQRDHELPAVINPDGTAGRDYTYLGLYGALLPAWGITAPQDAERLYTEAIAPVAGDGSWGNPDDYYAHNWVWFGLALWSDKTGRGPTPIGRNP